MPKKFIPWIKGFITAYGMRAVIGSPLKPEWFDEKTDYFTTTALDFLGNYDFIFLLFWIVCAVFFLHMEEKNLKADKGVLALSGVFSVLIPVGEVLRDFGRLNPLYGNVPNLVKTILIVVGFFLFFKEVLVALTDFIQKKNVLTGDSKFFSNHCFIKCFFILEIVYLLVVLINYPGNLCYDTEGQMMQVLGQMPYSTHHPLVSSLLMGLLVKFGINIFGSISAGIFIYMIIQTCLLSLALSYTISVLAKKGLKSIGLWLVLILYIVTPIYTNIASTAIKDVTYIAAFICYFVHLTELGSDIHRLSDKRFLISFVAFQIMTCLLRKNGYYMVVLTGIIWCIVNLKSVKELLIEEGKTKLILLRSIAVAVLAIFLAGTAVAYAVDTSLASVLHAEKGSKGEALSLPFQITAKYINDHYDELTDEEIEAISPVLGKDMVRIADRYNPALSDAVKSLYNKSASTEDLVKYIGTWTKMFFKHPVTYIEGFLVHTYGWYTPVVSPATRYETSEDDFYEPSGIFSVTDKLLIFLYRFADRISLLGALQNPGFIVWCFWYLTYLQRNYKKLRYSGIALWVGLLICFIAPGFMEHARYALPIIMTMPFYYTYTLIEINQENLNEKA